MKLEKLRNYILDIKGVPYENEQEAEQAWLKLQKEQLKASEEIAKSYEELPGWSNWFKRAFRYGISTLFMSSNILRKGKDYVKKDELIKGQEKAKDVVNVQTIDQWIEEVTRKHQISVRTKRDRRAHKRSRCFSDGSKINT